MIHLLLFLYLPLKSYSVGQFFPSAGCNFRQASLFACSLLASERLGVSLVPPGGCSSATNTQTIIAVGILNCVPHRRALLGCFLPITLLTSVGVLIASCQNFSLRRLRCELFNHLSRTFSVWCLNASFSRRPM